ncbi:hypothetical protein BS50DRAFT_624807 [Corynespora cassiicola Philippines]|uniref:C2H2-type domain-containing protein n=1 Tax=Corynespora cassiicola Philippines TaxID=1448308 RepID=A0A2T2N9H7_CORCC|nr:hypothetical protein BS50DRAFT_624807 [Corynespora cassiicola Philippines]
MFETENQIAEPSLSDPFTSGYNDSARGTCNLGIGPTDFLTLLEENIFPTASTSMSESSTPMTLSASSKTSAPFSRSQSQITWSFNEIASSSNEVSTTSSTISKEPVFVEPKKNLTRLMGRIRLPFACKNPRCDAQFVQQKQLDKHVQQNHKEYICSLCGKSFSHRKNHWEHVQSVHRGKKHSCNVDSCTYSTPRKSNLRRHQEKIHG